MIIGMLSFLSCFAFAADQAQAVPAHGWLMGGLMTLAIGSVGALLLKRYAVPAYRARVKAAIQKGLHPDTPDPKLNELLRDHFLTGAKLAEYLIPDRGCGGQRFAWVDEHMAQLGLPSEIRKVLIEEGVGVMDDELKEASKQVPGA